MRVVRYAEARLNCRVVEAKMAERQGKERYLWYRTPADAPFAGASICSYVRDITHEDTSTRASCQAFGPVRAVSRLHRG